MRSLCPEFSLFRQLDFAIFRWFQLLRLIEEEGPEAHLRDADWPVTPSLVEPLCLCFAFIYIVYLYDFYIDTDMVWTWYVAGPLASGRSRIIFTKQYLRLILRGLYLYTVRRTWAPGRKISSQCTL